MTSAAEIDQLFIRETPLIDVRAPVEFHKGAFPAAVNLPILDDAERERVGICYRDNGPAAARELGHSLVSGPVKEQRIAAWQQFIAEHPDAWLYCFRGGERSDIAIRWLQDSGYEVPRIAGGYKRLRGHLLATFECLPRMLVVAGKTGTGKTRFLAPWPHAIDLEAQARHRGSAFGRHIDAQPSQVDFENAVAIEFLKRRDLPFVLLEDEGRLIGRIHVPLPLQASMQEAPLLLVEEPLPDRVQLIFDEYIVDQWGEYRSRFGEAALSRFSEYLLNAADAIRKRLGNVAHADIRHCIEAAVADQSRGNGLDRHRIWIERLLVEYYDPMYEYQLKKKLARVRVRGTRAELQDWLQQQGPEL